MGRQRITGRALAAKIGRPPNTVSRWVSGEVPMSLDHLELVAAALDISLGDLLESAYGERPTPDPHGRTGRRTRTLPRLDSNQQPTGYRWPQRTPVTLRLAS